MNVLRIRSRGKSHHKFHHDLAWGICLELFLSASNSGKSKKWSESQVEQGKIPDSLGFFFEDKYSAQVYGIQVSGPATKKKQRILEFVFGPRELFGTWIFVGWL